MIPFEVGVYKMMVAFIRKSNIEGNRDVIMRPKNADTIENKSYTIHYTDGTTKPIEISIRSLIIGSWADDYTDAMRFGYLESEQTVPSVNAPCECDLCC